jgi:peptidyl-prolyl cis-trans isomerase SurA
MKKILFLLVWLPNLVIGQQMVVDRIIAKVNGHIVLQSDLEQTLIRLKEENMLPPGEEGKCEVFKQLVFNKVMYAKAEVDSILIEDGAVEQEMTRRFDYFERAYGGIENMVKVLGRTPQQLRDELRQQVREQMTLEKVQREITNNIKVTPAEVRKYFSRIPADSLPFLPAEVSIGVLVKYPQANEKEVLRIKALLNDLKSRIQKGEDFGELAKKFSEDLGSAKQGGDLGWQGRGDFVPEFEAAALRLSEGELSEPVQSEFGIHLIQLIKRLGNRFRCRHILIKPRPSLQDFAEAQNFLDSLRKIILKDSASFERSAMLHSDDKATKPYGGMMRNQLGESSISTEEIDPAIFFTIDKMKVGQITEPLKFRGEDGREGLRIFYLKKHILPHYANLKDDYQKIAAAAANTHKTEAVEKWIKKALKEVFIEIEPEFERCNILKGI